jgi:peroxiredoxin
VSPPLTLESVDGKPVSLADLRGRAAFLYFWESG